MPRQSVAREAVLDGAGIHTGLRVRMRLKPAPAGRGIGFVRTDLPGAPRLGLEDRFRDGPPFRTALKRGPAEVHTIEHVMSAFYGLGLTDITVEVDGGEIPALDGSALPFAEALREAGIVELPGPGVAVLTVERAVSVREGAAHLTAEPHSGGLKLSYTLDYPGEPLAQGSFSLTVDSESYLKEIAPARTFCLRKEAEALRAAGFGKGAGTHNTLVLDGGQVLETALRFPDEPVRHKMLDLLGDLYLLGCPLHAHVIAHRSGHALNRALSERLAGRAGRAGRGVTE